jgi:hypothetical protein
MGMFSKKKTYIESTTVSIHEELPDTVRQSILTSIIKDRSISDDLNANALNGLGMKVKSYYKYGRDQYHHGLPEGSTELKHASSYAMKLVLDILEGEPVVVESLIFSVADSNYFAEEYFDVLKTVESTQWEDNSNIRINYTDLTTEVVTVPSVTLTARYYHVRYTVQTVVKYFFYISTDTTYESLAVTDTVKESQYFPVVPFIRDNVDLSAPNEGDPLFDTSKKLLKKIGVDFEKVGAGIQENPDIDGVDHAYLVIVAPVQSESKSTQEYLFNYFFRLSQQQTYTKADYDNWEISEILFKPPPPLNRITVKESENIEKGIGNYHTELGFSYIETETVTGSIGKPKTVTRSTVINPRVESDEYAYERSYMIWRKQITLTEYTELRVVGLKHVNYVYKTKHIDTSLEDSLSEDNDDFNLPIHIGVLSEMTILRQTDVMNDSIRICFNSIEIIKLKWYQTGVFKALIIIVAAVITVMSGDGTGQIMTWAMAITSASAAAISTLIVAVILTAIINIGIGMLIDVIGEEKVAFLQLVYTIYLISQGDFTSISADLAVQMVSGFTQGLNFYIKNESHAIMSDYEELLAEQEAQQAELDELIEAFPTSTMLDPMAILDFSTSLQTQFETPTAYFNTRIHTGNIGALLLQDTQFFVDRNLQLEGITDRGGLDI